MFEAVLPVRFEEPQHVCKQDHAGDGLTLLHALALFQEGDVESAMRCLRGLRESGGLAELVDLLCPDFPVQRDLRAQRIRRRVLNPASSPIFRERESGAMPVMGGSIAALDLTARQRLVLRLVRDGLSNKQIAARLLISTNTVKWHLKTISRLLGAANRCSVLRIAESRSLL